MLVLQVKLLLIIIIIANFAFKKLTHNHKNFSIIFVWKQKLINSLPVIFNTSQKITHHSTYTSAAAGLTGYDLKFKPLFDLIDERRNQPIKTAKPWPIPVTATHSSNRRKKWWIRKKRRSLLEHEMRLVLKNYDAKNLKSKLKIRDTRNKYPIKSVNEFTKKKFITISKYIVKTNEKIKLFTRKYNYKKLLAEHSLFKPKLYKESKKKNYYIKSIKWETQKRHIEFRRNPFIKINKPKNLTQFRGIAKKSIFSFFINKSKFHKLSRIRPKNVMHLYKENSKWTGFDDYKKTLKLLGVRIGRKKWHKFKKKMVNKNKEIFKKTIRTFKVSKINNKVYQNYKNYIKPKKILKQNVRGSFIVYRRFYVRFIKRNTKRVDFFTKRTIKQLIQKYARRIKYKNKPKKFFVKETKKRQFNLWKRNEIKKKLIHSVKKIYFFNKEKLLLNPVHKKISNQTIFSNWLSTSFKMSTVSWIIFTIFEILLLSVILKIKLGPSLQLSKQIVKYKLFSVNGVIKKENYIIIPFEIVITASFINKILQGLSAYASISTNYRVLSKIMLLIYNVNKFNKIWVHNSFIKSIKTSAAISLGVPNLLGYHKPFKILIQNYLTINPNAALKKSSYLLSNIFITIKSNLFFYIPFLKLQLQ